MTYTRKIYALAALLFGAALACPNASAQSANLAATATPAAQTLSDKKTGPVYLVYFDQKLSQNTAWNTKTGEATQLGRELPDAGIISVSPDERWVVLRNDDQSAKHRGSIWLVPIDGGSATRIARLTKAGQSTNNKPTFPPSHRVSWSADGNALGVQCISKRGPYGVCLVDGLREGKPVVHEISALPGESTQEWVIYTSIAPDGKSIAWMEYHYKAREYRLRMATLAEDGARELARIKLPFNTKIMREWSNFFDYSPDGASVGLLTIESDVGTQVSTLTWHSVDIASGKLTTTSVIAPGHVEETNAAPNRDGLIMRVRPRASPLGVETGVSLASLPGLKLIQVAPHDTARAHCYDPYWTLDSRMILADFGANCDTEKAIEFDVDLRTGRLTDTCAERCLQYKREHGE